MVEHEDSARRLEEPLSADGWTFDRDVLMVLARPADREADTDGVVEIHGDAASELMRQWVSDDPKMTAATLDQVIDATAREARARAATNLGIRDEAGELVAMTKLYSDGVTAQVEDVYTVPAWRNRGCARRLDHARNRPGSRGRPRARVHRSRRQRLAQAALRAPGV